ncbi:MAG: methyltransferase, partial [Candidatus Delongbacteria bacterium]|nr:methyltransferase [Candidatus Delongbacteria bacterium]
MIKHYCSLCNYETSYILTFRNKEYFKCPNCKSIQMHPDSFISLEKEKRRYELHNNDVFDLGYQNFVKPILEYIFNNCKITDRGLDFGAGHGPVIAKILKDKNFDVK